MQHALAVPSSRAKPLRTLPLPCSLAAHSILSQLWILISYVVDGFAAAGIVLGSRLAAHAHNPLTAAPAKRWVGAGIVQLCVLWRCAC